MDSQLEILNSQTYQDVDLVIDGYNHWTDLAPKSIKYRDGKEVDFVQYLTDYARWNGTSTANRLVSVFFQNSNLKLIELEVTGTNPRDREHGRCRWLADHPSYQSNMDDDKKKILAIIGPGEDLHYISSLVYSVFVDEKGEETGLCGVLSVSGCVIHKSYIIHRARFASMESVVSQ